MFGDDSKLVTMYHQEPISDRLLVPYILAKYVKCTFACLAMKTVLMQRQRIKDSLLRAR